MGLAAVRDLREVRRLETPEEIEAFEQDVLAGFVLARASAGMADRTIKQETSAVIELRQWFGRPLWEVEPPDLDRYFGVYHRGRPPATLANKAQSISVFWQYLELRHKVEIYNLTGRVVESPLDEMNRPRARAALNLRIPPKQAEIKQLFDGWRDELRVARKFAVAARNYTSARLIGQVGLRINEARTVDLDDIKWDVGPLGKLHVRFGKGHGGRGPKQRMVPLINGAQPLLAWFVADVRGQFDDAWDRPGAPLFPSERHTPDGNSARVGDDALRDGLAEAVDRHLPDWRNRLTPHVLRHYCASSLYQDGMDIIVIQELLGHEWIATTMGYIHVLRTHVEDAWVKAGQRAATRLGGSAR
jgi:site-specific recombinase XerD